MIRFIESYRVIAIARIASTLALTLAPFAAHSAGGLPRSSRSAQQTGLTPVFDWSVPDRLHVDPVTQMIVATVEVGEGNWQVDFNACASTGNVTGFRWTVEGDSMVHVTSNCRWSYVFPSEGIFSVSLSVIDASGSSAPAIQDVTVQDWLIVAIGDSYGSGEGNPDIPIPPSAVEQWARALADHAQALVDLAEADRILGLIGRIRAPLTDLISATADWHDALARQAFHCAIPLDPLCFTATADVIAASGRIADATTRLTVQLTAASVEAGFEGLLDSISAPAHIRDRLDELDQIWRTGRQLALDTIALTDGVLAFPPQPTWSDRQCHRSSFAGQAQAALALEQADPRTSVTLVHLSCSGAKVSDLLLRGYRGIDPSAGGELTGQIDQALELIGEREVDAILVSIGGNDANFGSIVKACIAEEPCSDAQFVRQPLEGLNALCRLVGFFTDACGQYYDEISNVAGNVSGIDLFTSGVGTLPGKYAELDSKLAGTFPAISRDRGRVYITEYPNATQDENGSTCGPRPERVDPFVNLPGLSPVEWAWAGESVTRTGLNVAVGTGAANHGWTLVTGIFDDFANHGYCADGNWLVRIQDSFLRQRDANGTLHPTRDGHADVAGRILASIEPALYQSGDLRHPRVPQVAPIANAGGPWVLDEGSVILIENSTLDPARTGLSFRWSLQATPAAGATLTDAAASTPILTAVDDSMGTLNVVVENAFGASSASAQVIVRNVPPVVTAGSNLEVIEGDVTVLHASFVDPGLADTHTASVDWGDSSPVQPALVAGRDVIASHTYVQNGTAIVTVRVRDDDGGEGTDTVRVTVLNAPPVITSIIGPIDPLLSGNVANMTAHFADPGVLDTHLAIWNWDDGTSSSGMVLESSGSGETAATHAFTSAGVYQVGLVLADSDGASAQATWYIIVIDPNAGFVTGAGVIESPAGAYSGDPAFVGSAHFNFSVRYHRGTLVPTGSAAFRFGRGVTLRSDSLAWLVVMNSKAQLKGAGTLDGVPGYSFLLTAYDNQRNAADRFRIKIWHAVTGQVVFDNARGSSDDLDDAQPSAIVAGNIVIHT